MSGKRGKEKDGATLVIRREEAGDHGHHGGAWKVAYADFVTAMMAFFLLMWLLSSTTEEQRLGIANYFAPTNIFGMGDSGSGKPFGGLSPVDDGSLVGRAGTPTVQQRHEGGPPPQDDTTESSGERPERAAEAGEKPHPHRTGGHFAHPRAVGSGGEDATDRGAADREGPHALAARGAQEIAARSAAEIAAQAEAEAAAAAETEALEAAAEAIRAAVADDPELGDLARQPMFGTASAEPSARVRALLAKVAPTLGALGNPVTIIGHTDAEPFRSGAGLSNWELSANRANATRRVLVEAGLAEAQIRSVTGVADREPLLPAEPRAAANRRIAILLQRLHPVPGS